MARHGGSRPRIERSSVVAALVLTAVTLTACGTEDEPSAASTPPPAGSEVSPTAPTPPPVESSSPATEPTSPPVTAQEPPSDPADVAGAELVCPAVANALALASEAGWGPGAGSDDESVTAALSGSLVIDLVPDLPNDQVQALWDAADSIATAECPSDAQQLVDIYGATSLREILGAA